MPVIVAAAFALVAGTVVGAPGVAAFAEATDEDAEAAYEYRGGFEAFGNLTGVCNGSAWADPGSSFVLDLERVEVDEIIVWWNETVLDPSSPSPTYVRSPAKARIVAHELLAGTYVVKVHAAEGVIAAIVAAEWPASSSGVSLGFNASRVVGSRLVNDAALFDLWMPSEDGQAVPKTLSLDGWTRPVSMNGTWSYSGDAAWILRGFTLTGPEGHWEVPVFYTTTLVDLGSVAIRQVEQRHVIFRGSVEWTEPAGSWSVACGAMRYGVLGNLTVFDAVGRAGTADVAGQALTMAGEFVVDERPLPMSEKDSGRPPPVTAQAIGRVGTVFVDYEVVADPAVSSLVTGAVVGGAVVFAFAGALLFSRLRSQELVEREPRSSILEAVRVSPGIRQIELARVTEIPLGTLRHHLLKLQQHEAIVSKRSRGQVRYWVIGAPVVAEPRFPDPLAERVRELSSEGPVQYSALARVIQVEFGYGRSGAFKRLRGLIDEGTLHEASEVIGPGRWVKCA